MLHTLETRTVIKWALLVVVMSTLGWVVTHLATPAVLPVDDFVEYWAAGRLNATGGNPYDPVQLRVLETEVGWPEDKHVVMMWNPPWTLTLAMPFGLLSYPVGRILWLGLHFVLIVICADWAWRFYGGPARLRWLAWIIAFTFAPALFVLNAGQIGTLILVGVVAFLYFGEREQWWLAGVSATLITIKPHLLYLFWVALILWSLDRRRWAVILGVGVAGLVGTAIPLAVNPNVISQYLHTVQTEPPFYWATPTQGSMLRLMFGVDLHWLQFAPSVLGLLWFLVYWRRHKDTWNWAKQMPLLLLMSVFTTSYGWEYDQVVLLPAVMQGAVWIRKSNQRWIKGVAMAGHLTITALALAVNIVVGSAFWYVWLAPAFLLGYILIRIHRTGGWAGWTARTETRHASYDFVKLR